MKRVGPFSVEGAILIVVAILLLVGVSTCNARRDGARQERIAQLESNAYKSSLAAIQARRVTDSVVQVSVKQERVIVQQSVRLRRIGKELDDVLAQNGAIIADSFADVPTLRAQLQRTTEVAQLFRDSTAVLLRSVERMIAAHEVERTAWLAERGAHLAEIAAKDSLIAVLRESEQSCRLILVRCPTRVQSAGIGALSVLVLLLL